MCLGFGHGRLGGAVHGGDEFVGLLAQAEGAHQAFDLLQALGQRNLHLGIAEEAVGAAERRDRLAGALGQASLRPPLASLLVRASKRDGMGRRGEEQGGERRRR